MKKKDRYSLEFPAGAKEQFDLVKEKSGSATITEVFRKAVSFYEYFLDQQKEGGKVVIEYPGKDREVIRIY